MTSEEIKQQNSMRDILGRYGIVPNRAGFIRCPFHFGDHTASMKIYKDSYYCFGCGASGDIFSFVQRMDQCDFKTAFGILGGSYGKPSFSSKIAIYHHQKKMAMRQKEERQKKEKLQDCIAEIDWWRRIRERCRPLSDGWCEAVDGEQKALRLHGELTGLPY